MTPHPPSGTPAPRCPGVLTNCPSPRALLSRQLTGAEGLGGEAGNRQGAPGWGGKPQGIWSSGDKAHLMAKETQTPALLSRATPTVQPLRGTAAPERGSQYLEVAIPYPPPPPPLRRTPAPYPLSVAAPLCSAGAPPPAAARSRGCPPLGSARAASPPPAPRGAPGPARPAAAASQGRFGLRSRHSRGGAGGAGEEGGGWAGRVGSTLRSPSFVVEPVCPQIRLHPWGSKLGAKAEGQGPNFGVSDALTDLDDGGALAKTLLSLAGSLPSWEAKQGSIPSTLPVPEEMRRHRDVASSHWEKAALPRSYPQSGTSRPSSCLQ